jgi:predicted Abi (CAAX) family protease
MTNNTISKTNVFILMTALLLGPFLSRLASLSRCPKLCPCDLILVRRLDRHTEGMSCAKHKVRIPKELPSKQNDIRMITGHDLLRLVWLGDQADGANRNVGESFLDSFRKRNLVSERISLYSE